MLPSKPVEATLRLLITWLPPSIEPVNEYSLWGMVMFSASMSLFTRKCASGVLMTCIRSPTVLMRYGSSTVPLPPASNLFSGRLNSSIERASLASRSTTAMVGLQSKLNVHTVYISTLASSGM